MFTIWDWLSADLLLAVGLPLLAEKLYTEIKMRFHFVPRLEALETIAAPVGARPEDPTGLPLVDQSWDYSYSAPAPAEVTLKVPATAAQGEPVVIGVTAPGATVSVTIVDAQTGTVVKTETLNLVKGSATATWTPDTIGEYTVLAKAGDLSASKTVTVTTK